MKNNKIIPALALASLCLLGTGTIQATTPDKMILAARCFTISHNLEALISEQTEEFCKEKLKKSSIQAQSLGQYIMSDSRVAKQSPHETSVLLSDKEITSCVKSQCINRLLQEMNYIAITAFG